MNFTEAKQKVILDRTIACDEFLNTQIHRLIYDHAYKQVCDQIWVQGYRQIYNNVYIKVRKAGGSVSIRLMK